MRCSFHPRLIHDPFSDPGLFVRFLFQKRAFLFDLGEIQNLPARDLLKVTHVFVTHAHVDHFIGFDHLLRVTLGREKKIHFFGPPGFFVHVEGKLSGYIWNLVGEYPRECGIRVTEVHPDFLRTKVYVCRDQFRSLGGAVESPFKGILLAEPSFRVNGAFLDHRTPCLAFALEEDFYVKILKDRLNKMGLPVGPWLTRFKRALHQKEDPNTVFEVPWEDGKTARRETAFTLGELADKIALVGPGQKIAYVTDLIGSPENLGRAAMLAKGADHLFIEAGFLDRDRDMAREKYHLTAKQSGELARKAGVREFTLFHHSPRYTGREEELRREALSAFETLEV